jgi:RHH-type proline utilization regulon transcriptional repressor/proline dehydrogenase/delta 1-pyrroline-5-carboxylate dehydrogenase
MTRSKLPVAILSSRALVVLLAGSWVDRAASLGSGRKRLLGTDVKAITSATRGRPDLAIYADAPTESGRLEMLPYLREQAISITSHRFGTPNHLTDHLV